MLPALEFHLSDVPASVKIGPLGPGHPMLSSMCVGCGAAFAPDDVITGVPVGPGDDPEMRALARAGRPYRPVVVPMHWACATGSDP